MTAPRWSRCNRCGAVLTLPASMFCLTDSTVTHPLVDLSACNGCLVAGTTYEGIGGGHADWCPRRVAKPAEFRHDGPPLAEPEPCVDANGEPCAPDDRPTCSVCGSGEDVPHAWEACAREQTKARRQILECYQQDVDSLTKQRDEARTKLAEATKMYGAGGP